MTRLCPTPEPTWVRAGARQQPFRKVFSTTSDRVPKRKAKAYNEIVDAMCMRTRATPANAGAGDDPVETIGKALLKRKRRLGFLTAPTFIRIGKVRDGFAMLLRWDVDEGLGLLHGHSQSRRLLLQWLWKGRLMRDGRSVLDCTSEGDIPYEGMDR